MEINKENISPATHIRTLSDTVANQIAAGEVVERPASILKELIENSIDAGANRISVTIRNGGKSLVEVEDNGSGMTPDDALLSLERHATSKIKSADDLKSVSTLGFRGEALPSIASVGRMTVVTGQGDVSSTEISIDGGKIKHVREAAPISGTIITVRDLFFNTPVRRKFLRSESVESEQAVEAVYRQALARPDIAFTMYKGDREVLRAPAVSGDDGLATRIADVFGKNIIEEITPVNFESGGMRLTGYVSRPGVTRSTRSTQYIYLNGRHIKDRLVGYAVSEAFRSLIPKGRHPLLFLSLNVPQDRIDVNVHPTKTEVRFVDGRSVVHLVRSGIAEVLGEAKEAGGATGSTGYTFSPAYPQSGSSHSTGSPDPWAPYQSTSTKNLYQPVTETAPPTFPSTVEGNQEIADNDPKLFGFDRSISDNFKALGQIFGAFLLIEEEGRLLLLDQHTAHERVLYEKFSLKYRDGAIASQELLFPEQIELPKSRADFMNRHLSDFARLGYAIEEFGETLFTIRAVPSLLTKKDHKGVILDLMERLDQFGETGDFSVLAEEAINIMACRAAVKANDSMSVDEIEGLVRQLKECRMPYTCPHGRPIALSLERDDLLKGFLR